MELRWVLLLSIFWISSTIAVNDNDLVVFVEYFTKPLASSNTECWKSSGKRFLEIVQNWRLEHAGIVVRVTDGSRWIIHRGPNWGNGAASDTIIEPASVMGSEWRLERSRDIRTCGKRVIDFRNAALPNSKYNLLTANCQTAANGMWNMVVRDC